MKTNYIVTVYVYEGAKVLTSDNYEVESPPTKQSLSEMCVQSLRGSGALHYTGESTGVSRTAVVHGVFRL